MASPTSPRLRQLLETLRDLSRRAETFYTTTLQKTDKQTAERIKSLLEKSQK